MTVRWRSVTPVLVVALAWLAASACSGGSSPATLPAISSAQAERDIVDGAPVLSSSVRLRFDRPLTFAPRKVPLESLFEFAVEDENGEAQRVFVDSAETRSNGREVLLQVQRLIPSGATVKVVKRAFIAKAEGELTATVESDVSPLQALLASVVLIPDDVSIIQVTNTPAPTAADRDPVAVRLALTDHLARRGVSAATASRALARYDAIPTDIVPAPKARAALAALTGTFAEPAIDALLTGENCTGRPVASIAFEPPPGDPGLLGQVTHLPDGRRKVSLNPLTEGETIDHLMPILAHEAIHCDPEGSLLEEVIATAFDSFLYLTLVTNSPGIIAAGTILARDLNADAIAMINSGRALPESVGLLTSPSDAPFFPPGRSNARSFADFISAAYGDIEVTSPPEPLAQLYADAIAEATGQQSGDVFDVRYLDQLLGFALDPRALIALIEAFRLVPVHP